MATTQLEAGDTVVVHVAGALPGVDQFTPLVVEAVHDGVVDLTLAHVPNGAGYLAVDPSILTKIGA